MLICEALKRLHVAGPGRDPVKVVVDDDLHSAVMLEGAGAVGVGWYVELPLAIFELLERMALGVPPI